MTTIQMEMGRQVRVSHFQRKVQRPPGSGCMRSDVRVASFLSCMGSVWRAQLQANQSQRYTEFRRGWLVKFKFKSHHHLPFRSITPSTTKFKDQVLSPCPQFQFKLPHLIASYPRDRQGPRPAYRPATFPQLTFL